MRGISATGARLAVDVAIIGLIGSGRIGSTVARLAVDGAHEALLSNSREPETLRDVVASLGSRAARAVTSEEAAMLGDLVVVAVPVGASAAGRGAGRQAPWMPATTTRRSTASCLSSTTSRSPAANTCDGYCLTLRS
jgi:prephenate dehydrogenase